jgi:transcription elongation factor GreA
MSLHSSIPRIPFTAQKLQEMQDEYDALLKEEQELIVRVNTARQMGDLSENGAYKYGKIELGNVRHRLRELKHLLSRAQVITSAGTGVIEFGSTVTLKNDQKTLTFTLVSHHEADPAEGKLSDQSPIGREVKGKKVGDTVTVKTPAQETTYTISAVQ